MVKRYALMESLSANLQDFLEKVSENLTLSDKKFLLGGQWTPIRSELLAEHKPALHPFSKAVKRHGRVILRLSQVGKGFAVIDRPQLPRRRS